MQILATHRALFGRGHGNTGTAKTMSEADIVRVVEVLDGNQEGGGWALIGAHPFSLVVEPRATNDLGADLLRRRKPDRFREVGFGAAVRIDRQRVASAA